MSGLLLLALPARPANAQTQPRSFEIAAGFVMQPGMGVDVNVLRRLTLRLAADLPIFANRDYVYLRPRLSARVVVALGR